MVKLYLIERIAVFVGLVGSVATGVSGLISGKPITEYLGIITLFFTAINVIFITALNRDLEECQTTHDKEKFDLAISKFILIVGSFGTLVLGFAIAFMLVLM